MKMLKIFEQLGQSLAYNPKEYKEEKTKDMEKKDSWEEINNKLIKTYYFDDHSDVAPFVNKVMAIAEKQNHHPDIIVHYDNVKLSITNHEKGKVTDKCHKLASAIDKVK